MKRKKRRNGDIKKILTKPIKEVIEESPKIEEFFTTKTSKDLSQCCCDFTAHCPVHGSRKFDPHCYIAQG